MPGRVKSLGPPSQLVERCCSIQELKRTAPGMLGSAVIGLPSGCWECASWTELQQKHIEILSVQQDGM